MASRGYNPYAAHSLSGRERAQSERTLVCLLRGIHGYITAVELRNETVIVGKVLNCDGYMNILLQNATMTKINGKKERFSEICIMGTHIRYVHIPDEIDMMSTIEIELNKMGKTRATGSHHGRGKKQPRGRSRGRGRGRGHLQTVSEDVVNSKDTDSPQG